MKKRSVIVISVVLIAAAGAAVYYFADRGNQPSEWLTLNADQGNLDVVVAATGTIEPDTTVQVGTQVSGTIAELYADWNSYVKKGETIARLDTTFLWVSVEEADANLEKAQIEQDEDSVNLKRAKQLFDRSLESQADYDTSVATFQSAEADVNAAQTALEQAEINLSYATIKAPISGIIVSRNVDIGETVASSYSTPTLFSIANSLKDMQVDAYVDEGDIGSIKDGEPVSFNVDAYPNKVFSGRVTQIRLQPDTLQNVVEYVVIIDAPNPDLKLLPGMTANLTIHIAEARSVLMVPTTALLFVPPPEYLTELSGVVPDSIVRKIEKRIRPQGASSGFGQGGQQPNQTRSLIPGSYFVAWTLKGARIEPVRVRVGLSNGTDTQVEGDLTAGEPVVVGMLIGSR